MITEGIIGVIKRLNPNIFHPAEFAEDEFLKKCNNILFNIPDCPRQTIIVQMLKTIIKFAEENPAKIVLLSVRDKRAVAKSAKIPGTKEGNNERAHMIVVDDKIQRNSLG